MARVYEVMFIIRPDVPEEGAEAEVVAPAKPEKAEKKEKK